MIHAHAPCTMCPCTTLCALWPHSPRNRVGAIWQLHCWKTWCTCRMAWCKDNGAWCIGHGARGMLQRAWCMEAWCMCRVAQCNTSEIRDTRPLHFTTSEIRGIRCLCFQRHVSDFIDASLILEISKFSNFRKLLITLATQEIRNLFFRIIVTQT